MKKLNSLIFVLVSLSFASSFAAEKRKTQDPMASKVSTDHEFNDLTVRGNYQSPNEGLVTVENEKVIQDLLDYRTDYKDRLSMSKQLK